MFIAFYAFVAWAPAEGYLGAGSYRFYVLDEIGGGGFMSEIGGGGFVSESGRGILFVGHVFHDVLVIQYNGDLSRGGEDRMFS